MEALLLVLVVIAWFWSIIRGIQVSALCVICNFFFPPLSQLIFAIYEDNMKGPLILMSIGFVGLFILKQ